jgi:hypothetical protein
MAEVTVTQFAEVLKVPVEKLLVQLGEAGIKVGGANDIISDEAKMELLTHLRRAHGRQEDPAAPRKITLQRKQQQEIKLASTQGRARTVAVEVRKKKTYLNRSVIEEAQRQRQEEVDRARTAEESARVAEESARTAEETARTVDESERERERLEAEQRRAAEELERERLEAEQRRALEEEARQRAEADARQAAEQVARERTERTERTGDGLDGGIGRVARFDLDMNDPPVHRSVSRTIEGAEITCDEAALTDDDILCGDAWRGLYEGSADERCTPMAGRCGLCAGAAPITGQRNGAFTGPAGSTSATAAGRWRWNAWNGPAPPARPAAGP